LTGAHGGQAIFGYLANYLIDAENAIIVDVEAATAIRQAEVLAAKRFDLYPATLIGDTNDLHLLRHRSDGADRHRRHNQS
jgi:hypothetical protein